jgi:hypothetical protein
MTTSNLFTAILALDSYNRGFKPQLNIADSSGLGNATLGIATRNVQTEATGFFAQAYDWFGTTVISYRGTDHPNPVNKANDFWGGWTIGLGYTGATQAGLAIDFYKEVTGASTVYGSGLGKIFFSPDTHSEVVSPGLSLH